MGAQFLLEMRARRVLRALSISFLYSPWLCRRPWVGGDRPDGAGAGAGAETQAWAAMGAPLTLLMNRRRKKKEG